MTETSCPFHTMGPKRDLSNFDRNIANHQDLVPTYYPEGTRGQSIAALLFLAPALNQYMVEWRKSILNEDSNVSSSLDIRKFIDNYLEQYDTSLELLDARYNSLPEHDLHRQGLIALAREGGLFTAIHEYLRKILEYGRKAKSDDGLGFYNSDTKVKCPAEKIMIECILLAFYYNMQLSKAGIELQHGSVSITHDSEAAPFGRKFCTQAQIIQQYNLIVDSARKDTSIRTKITRLFSWILACKR